MIKTLNDLREIIELSKRARFIANSKNITWKSKFDLVFSESISRRVFHLYPDFKYYDPDTSYEDDVMAFVISLEGAIDDLGKSFKFFANEYRD